MRDHDDVPYIVIERSGSGMAPFVWGALMGAAAALLFAPKSGAETQRDLKERATKLRELGANEETKCVRDAPTRLTLLALGSV